MATSPEQLDTDFEQSEGTDILTPRAPVINAALLTPVLQSLFEEIDRSQLVPGTVEKIELMLGDYTEAVATARELDSNCKIIDLEEIVIAMKRGGIDLLRAIGERVLPVIEVVPNNSFKDKVRGMNAHRHFNFMDPQYGEIKQQELQLHRTGGSMTRRFDTVETETANRIVVSEGVPAAPSIPNESEIMAAIKQARISGKHEIRAKYETFEDHCRALTATNNIAVEMIDVHAYMALVQRSLRTYAKAQLQGDPKAHKKVIDLIDLMLLEIAGSITLLNDKYLTPDSNADRRNHNTGMGVMNGITFTLRYDPPSYGGLRIMRPRAMIEIMRY